MIFRIGCGPRKKTCVVSLALWFKTSVRFLWLCLTNEAKQPINKHFRLITTMIWGKTRLKSRWTIATRNQKATNHKVGGSIEQTRVMSATAKTLNGMNAEKKVLLTNKNSNIALKTHNKMEKCPQKATQPKNKCRHYNSSNKQASEVVL